MIKPSRISRLCGCFVVALLVAPFGVLIGGGTVSAAPLSPPSEDQPKPNKKPKKKPHVESDPACAITELHIDIDFVKKRLLVYADPSAPPIDLWGQSFAFVFAPSVGSVTLNVNPIDGSVPRGHVLDANNNKLPIVWNGDLASVTIPSSKGDLELYLDPSQSAPIGKSADAMTDLKPMPKLVLKPTDTCPK